MRVNTGPTACDGADPPAGGALRLKTLAQGLMLWEGSAAVKHCLLQNGYQICVVMWWYHFSKPLTSS